MTRLFVSWFLQFQKFIGKVNWISLNSDFFSCFFLDLWSGCPLIWSSQTRGGSTFGWFQAQIYLQLAVHHFLKVLTATVLLSHTPSLKVLWLVNMIWIQHLKKKKHAHTLPQTSLGNCRASAHEAVEALQKWCIACNVHCVKSLASRLLYFPLRVTALLWCWSWWNQ